MHLVEVGVTLNLDKCQFSTDRVKFFGHVTSSSGIEADPEKLQAIADLLPPQKVQEVRTYKILKSYKQLQTYRHLRKYKK